jgi:hypothetical protein
MNVAHTAQQLVQSAASSATAVSDLVAAADGRRSALEDGRDVFIDRLHRVSDDYAATKALRLIYAAIDAVDTENRAEPVPAKTARRWSQRGRAARRLDARDLDRDTRIASRAVAAHAMAAAVSRP